MAHDLIAICDEVWENVRFDGKPHRSLLALPGMAERTIKIGSAGKIFGATGWKVGWMVAAPAMAAVLGRAHQFLTFTTPPMLQWALQRGAYWDSGEIVSGGRRAAEGADMALCGVAAWR